MSFSLVWCGRAHPIATATAAKHQFTYLFASHNRWEASRAFPCSKYLAESHVWYRIRTNQTNGVHTIYSFPVRAQKERERKKRAFFLLAPNAKAQTNFHNNNFKIEWNFILRTRRTLRWDASDEFPHTFFSSHSQTFDLISCCLCDAIYSRWIFMSTKDTHSGQCIQSFIHLFSVGRCRRWPSHTHTRRCPAHSKWKMPKLVLENEKRPIYCFDCVWDDGAARTAWWIWMDNAIPSIRLWNVVRVGNGIF